MFGPAGVSCLIPNVLQPLHPHRLPEEGAEGPMALTMCLEGLAVLLNADVALDPALSLAQRRINDCPGTAEASALVAAVLACLPNLGGERRGDEVFSEKGPLGIVSKVGSMQIYYIRTPLAMCSFPSECFPSLPHSYV